jgi:hypothetical protein
MEWTSNWRPLPSTLHAVPEPCVSCLLPFLHPTPDEPLVAVPFVLIPRDPVLKRMLMGAWTLLRDPVTAVGVIRWVEVPARPFILLALVKWVGPVGIRSIMTRCPLLLILPWHRRRIILRRPRPSLVSLLDLMNEARPVLPVERLLLVFLGPRALFFIFILCISTHLIDTVCLLSCPHCHSHLVEFN